MDEQARRNTPLYHITEIANLRQIIASGGLFSDARVGDVPHEVIGYGNIKDWRMREIQIPCCGHRFVGEFVPFYYCPRSVMLYTVKMGKTGKPVGHQREIVHLCTRVGIATDLGRDWAVSDGNAGARVVSFLRDLAALDSLNWNAIRTKYWQGVTFEKQAEFLVADFVPWASVQYIGCHSAAAVQRVQAILSDTGQSVEVNVRSEWYYP